MDEDCYNLNNFNELILKIKEILEGKKRYEYSLWVKIKYEKADELYTIWEQIKKNITKQNIDIMQNEINYFKDEHTITYEYIRKLHSLLEDIAEYGAAISNSLYVESFSLESFIKEADRLLQLLLGKIPIYITIKYTEYGIQYICT